MPLTAPRRGAIVILAASALLVTAVPALAHVIGLSRGEYTLTGTRLDADIALRADDLLLALPGADTDHDGRLSRSEMEAARAAIEDEVVRAIVVTSSDIASDASTDREPCPGTLSTTSVEGDAVHILASFTCRREPARLDLHLGFLDRLPADHRHLATVRLPRGSVDALCVLARPDIHLKVAEGPSNAFTSLFRAGIEHILTGADHLAFLLALVLGGTLAMRVDGDRAETLRRSAVPLALALTAFTAGHSVSLAVATLGGLAPPTRWVEAAVALSVAYVGAENLISPSPRRRWAVTLPFGCIHGFAFAGGLLPLGLPRARLPAALVAFNLGVEAGQLAVLALVLPALVLVRSRRWYPVLAKGLSALILLAGLGWLAARVA